MKKAIMFTCYDRPMYFEKTLKQWGQVIGLNEYDIYFSIDYSENNFETIENLIHQFELDNNLNVNISVNNPPHGVLRNPHTGLNLVFNKGYDFVIAAEEDLLPSADILNYFNFCSDLFLENKNILAICAHTKLNKDEDLVTIKPNFDCWLWGIWQNRWYNFLEKTWDFDYSFRGWDHKIRDVILPSNKLSCIYPISSRSKHIGVNGVHMRPNMHEELDINLNSNVYKFKWKQ
jgi:hypothetical protein